MKPVVIAGAGMIRFERRDEDTLVDMLAMAGLRAMDDAGAAERIENGPASGGSAIKHGYQAIASGMADVVLVVGGEKMREVIGPRATDVVACMSQPESEYIYGVSLPAMAGMFARLYMKKYGVTPEHLAQVAIKNHEHGLLNPYAHIHMKITLEGILTHPDSIVGNPIVADPLRLYDERAGCAPADVDVAELHDAFTILEIAESEHAGFFEKGEGAQALAAGETRLGGTLPINPSGGLKARGHPVGATGVAQAVELVWQLRSEAGERQVKDAQTGFALNFGGFGNNVVALVLRRES